MAYSGLGAGTVGDPYQITTVTQFMEMGVVGYAGKYFLLMNNLDFSSKSDFYLTHYALLDGSDFTISNIPCANLGFALQSSCAIKNITLKWSDTTYYDGYGCVFSNDGNRNTVTIDNVKIYNNILRQDRSMPLFTNSIVFDATSSLNNIVVDGSFNLLFPKVKGMLSNIKVLNTYRLNCPLLQLTYGTTLLEKFQYIKPFTIGVGTGSVYLIANVLVSGMIIRKGFIDFGKVTCGGSFGAVAISNSDYSGTTISNIFIKGDVTGTKNSNVYAIMGSKTVDDINPISNVFFWGNITTPNFTTRNSVLAQALNASLSNCYYNSDILTGIPDYSTSGQNPLTSSQFLVSSNFNTWDFSTIWSIGSQYPELIDAPKFASFTNSENNIYITSVARTNSNAAAVVLIPHSGDYGIDFVDASGEVAFNISNTASFNASLTKIVDQLYSVVGYYIENSVRKNVVKYNYLHFFEQSAIDITNINCSKVIPLAGTTAYGSYVHGSVFYNNNLYGSTRTKFQVGTQLKPGCIVKAPTSNISNYTLFPIYTKADLTGLTKDMDSLVEIGGNLYTMTYIDGDGKACLVKFNTLTDDYQVYWIGYGQGYGYTSCTDGTYLYVSIGVSTNNEVWKIDPSVFNSSEKWNVSTVWATNAIKYDCAGQGGLNKGVINPHAMVVDEGYLYIGMGSNSGTVPGGLYQTHKVNKSDMTFNSFAVTPKMTDDMTQNNTHLFIGLELSTIVPTEFGYGYGCTAIKKSDMSVLNIPVLHGNLYPMGRSYASLIFGNYLIDCQTNCYIYAIDISDIDSWSLNENIGARTLKAYKMLAPSPSSSMISQPINEVVLSENGNFYGFAWGDTSNVVEFNLTGLNYFAPPSVVTDDSAIIDDDSVSLSGSISHTGGKTVTVCGFTVGQLADLSDGINFPCSGVTTNFELAINSLAIGTYYWRAYAINSEGTGYGDVQNFEIAEPVAVPIVTNLGSEVNGYNVTMSGLVNDNGGEAYAECGIILGQLADLSDGVKLTMAIPVDNITVLVNNLGLGIYYFRPYATNSAGDGVGLIDNFEIVAINTDPGIPTDLSNAITVNIELAWNAPIDNGGANIAGYKIERKPNGGDWAVIVSNTDNTSTSYLDNVVPGIYIYRISTITTFSTGLPSAEFSVTATIGGGGASGSYRIYLGATEIAVM